MTYETGRWSTLPALVPVASTIALQLVDDEHPFGGPGGGGDDD